MLAKVAIPVPLGRAFTYLVPQELEQAVVSGARVLVSFGRRRVAGVVLEVGDLEAGFEPSKLKAILAVVDDEPVLSLELLRFLCELSRYYVAPIGEVLRLALPRVESKRAQELKRAGLLEGAEVASSGRALVFAVPVGGADPSLLGGRSAELYTALPEAGLAVVELSARFKSARAIVRRLERAGLVRLEQRSVYGHAQAAAGPVQASPFELNSAQEQAVQAIVQALRQRSAARFMLDGVTGSGKTEVYLRAVEECRALGGGALVLVPEIALTPQLLARFRARLGGDIGILHSGLSAAQRHAAWRSLQKGELKIAIGARSALFAPISQLMLVCVDEEHDPSFKQEEGVRYHARDMALLRAHRAGAVCVLGSATPSLNSVALVKSGRLTRLSLPGRAHQAARLPEVEVVDLRRIGAGPTGDRWLTLPLYRAIEGVLAQGQQSILFLNRRGYSPSFVCDACGQVVECPNCSVALTLHRAGKDSLRCHYCDYASPVPVQCPSCEGVKFAEEGAGTERVVAVLEAAFPKARIARLDRDVAPGAKSEPVLSRVRRGEVDILVGTQMVAKGHDLPQVTLVGVLNADAALSMPDFAASERSFHLLVQVAGRAGRGDIPGRVIIQTRQPEHPAVRLAAKHAVGAFAEVALSEREELGYPPFSHLALLRLDGLNEAQVKREAARLTNLARSVASPKVEVLGPAPSPIARVRNRYRYRFMLRTRDRKELHKVLLALARAPKSRMVRASIDVDPVNLLV